MASIGNRPLRVAIGVGHANTSGGNPYELVKNREVVKELLAIVRASTGWDVRCWTPNDGQGNFNGPLDAAAATVRGWVADGWLPDIVTEIHHQGLSNTSIRGGFVIYPDSKGLSGRKPAGDHIDLDVRAEAGAMAQIVCGAIGVPVWQSGVMSERSTGVGGQGWRLGFFGAVSDAYFINNACVFITEAATFTNPGDKAVMDAPGFGRSEAIGLLKAYAHLASVRMGWTAKYTIASDIVGGETAKPDAGERAFELRFETPIRTSPGFWDYENNKANFIKNLPRGTTGTVISGPKRVDGVDFYDLRIDGFGTGWVQDTVLHTLAIS